MADENDLTDFLASRRWNFMSRFNLSFRRRTTPGQTVPRDSQE